MLRSLSKNKLSPADAVALVPALAANASLTDLNLASNNLAGETDWVPPAKVQGEKQVGATVIYEGREMMISQIYSDGDVKMVDLTGVKALAAAVSVSAVLTNLE